MKNSLVVVAFAIAFGIAAPAFANTATPSAYTTCQQAAAAAYFAAVLKAQTVYADTAAKINKELARTEKSIKETYPPSKQATAINDAERAALYQLVIASNVESAAINSALITYTKARSSCPRTF